MPAAQDGNYGSHGSTHPRQILQVHVRFATHAQAEACVKQLHKEQLAIELTYRDVTACDEASNSTTNQHSKAPSGWCTFEQGASTVIAAFLHVAEQQAAARSLQLPLRFATAQATRPKVITIGGEVRHSVALSSVWQQLPLDATQDAPAKPTCAPSNEVAAEKDVSETVSSDSIMRATEEHAEALLRSTESKMARATFGQPHDRAALEQQLHELEWTLKAAADQVAAQHMGSGLTVDPAVLREVARNPARFQFRARASSLWPERSRSVPKPEGKTQLSSGGAPRANANQAPNVVQV